jgi:23S rRNA G2445 N2-methylase RlmL
VSNCSREEYLPKNAQISISVVSKNSRLEALGSLQSVSHKAILTKLDQKGNQSEKKTEQVFDIFLHLENDQLSLYLNTSGK